MQFKKNVCVYIYIYIYILYEYVYIYIHTYTCVCYMYVCILYLQLCSSALVFGFSSHAKESGSYAIAARKGVFVGERIWSNHHTYIISYIYIYIYMVPPRYHPLLCVLVCVGNTVSLNLLWWLLGRCPINPKQPDQEKDCHGFIIGPTSTLRVNCTETMMTSVEERPSCVPQGPHDP